MNIEKLFHQHCNQYCYEGYHTEFVALKNVEEPYYSVLAFNTNIGKLLPVEAINAVLTDMTIEEYYERFCGIMINDEEILDNEKYMHFNEVWAVTFTYKRDV